MKQLFYIFLFFSLNINFCFSQNNLGARLTAMGSNSVAVKDLWSLDGNPSGISAIKTSTIALNYSKFLFDGELSQQALALVIPFKNNDLGINFTRYGISEYNEIKVGAALAKKFGNKLAIALKANYHQIKIANYGATTAFSIDVGAMYEFNDALTFGASIHNPSLQNYNTKTLLTTLPTVIQFGGAYKASNKLLIATSISKDLNKAIDVGIGLEYNLLEQFSLRAGLTAKPFTQYGGFGLNYKKLTLDVAVISNPTIGYTPQIAVAYAF